LRVKRGLVVRAEVLLLEVERFVFVIAHARLAGIAGAVSIQDLKTPISVRPAVLA
jgi:hypothetical protein